MAADCKSAFLEIIGSNPILPIAAPCLLAAQRAESPLLGSKQLGSNRLRGNQNSFFLLRSSNHSALFSVPEGAAIVFCRAATFSCCCCEAEFAVGYVFEHIKLPAPFNGAERGGQKLLAE